MRGYAKVVYNDVPDLKAESPRNRRIAQVGKLRRMGHDVHFVIDPDPAVIEGLIEAGYNTLLCTYYSYAYPEWLPDAETLIRPWDTMVEEQDTLLKIRGLDKRTTRPRTTPSND